MTQIVDDLEYVVPKEKETGRRIRNLARNEAILAAAGFAIGGGVGAASMALLYAGAKSIQFAGSDRRISETISRGEQLMARYMALPAGLVLLFSGLGTGIVTREEAFPNLDIARQEATDRAVMRIFNGEKSASEQQDVRRWEPFGLHGKKIGEFQVTAKEIGTDGSCKSILLMPKDGGPPTVILASQPNRPYETHASCNAPPPAPSPDND